MIIIGFRFPAHKITKLILTPEQDIFLLKSLQLQDILLFSQNIVPKSFAH